MGYEVNILNNQKVEKIIDWAISELNVNKKDISDYYDTLEEKNLVFEDILDNLINKAIELTNINDYNNLKWRFVASRLLLYSIMHKANKVRKGLEINTYYDLVNKAVGLGIYDSKLLTYTKEELESIANEINYNYDLGFDYAGMTLLKNRYLMKYNGSYFELPQEMFLSIALLLALPEKRVNRLDIAKKIYHAIASRKLSLATPIVLNLRRPNGNLASCFITAMDDDLTNIYYTLDQLAQISKNAGGVGVNLSRVRGQGAYIKNIKNASGGVLPWIKLINDTAVAVNQLGSRSGAITVALDVWHRDIELFLDMQTENGDQRKKSFDVFPQIVMPDLFMQRVINNEYWTLLDPHEIRIKKGIELAELYGHEFESIYLDLEKDLSIELKTVVGARQLFKKFLKTTVETGLPYVFFKDIANKLNPNKHAGMIGNANLCTESFSNFKPSKIMPKVLSKHKDLIKQEAEAGEVHTCNLASLNLAEIKDNELEYYTKLGIRILDNAIDITKTPLPESEKHNTEYRILGLGIMGLADLLALKHLNYENAEKFVDNLFENIAYYSIEESSDLAKERGVYSKYSGSDYSKLILFGHNADWFDKNTTNPKRWDNLRDKITKQGMRNGGLIAIAPNTSTSLLMGCTASILPIYKKFFIDKSTKGAVPVCPPKLNSETFWYYKENPNINQKDVVNIVSKIQKWVDQGISMELIFNLNSNMRAKDLYDVYVDAWQKGCKTVYYIRSITLDANKKEECISCSG